MRTPHKNCGILSVNLKKVSTSFKNIIILIHILLKFKVRLYIARGKKANIKTLTCP